VPGGHTVEEACIIEVDNGKTFDVDSFQVEPACGKNSSRLGVGVQIYAADTHLHSSEALTEFTADWVVPPLPARDAGQVVYFWPGFKAQQPEMGLPVLQPVLQYGQRGGTWELQSWFVDASDSRYPVVTAPAVPVYPGDVITSYMKLEGSTWTVYGKDVTTGQESNLQIQYSRAGNTDYDYAMLVNENIGVDTTCSLMPQANEVVFTNVKVNGKVPQWTARANCKGDYRCDCGNSASIDSANNVHLGWRLDQHPLKTFHKEQVLRVFPGTLGQVHALRALDETEEFDFWTESRQVGVSVDIRCSGCQVLRSKLSALGVSNITVMISDLQAAIDEERTPDLSGSSGFDLAKYHSTDEILGWLAELVGQYPDICEIVSVGTSYQGRAIQGIKITGGTGKNIAGKRAFWLDGGIHAREWITVSTVTYMLAETLKEYGNDDFVTNWVDNYNIYYVPILNPDGYEYTRNGNRMWRKTMMPNPGQSSECAGTDPNRNWDWHWNEAGSSSNPCSESYSGQSAGDQPEVKAVMDYLKNKDDFLGYINFHSYSQLWMTPWGYTYSHPKDYEVQHAAGQAAVEALQAVHGTHFENGAIAEIIYEASGSSADYAYGACNILFAGGVELRDTGSRGFVLPESEIIPSGEETYAAVKAWAQYAMAHDPHSAIVTV